MNKINHHNFKGIVPRKYISIPGVQFTHDYLTHIVLTSAKELVFGSFCYFCCHSNKTNFYEC